MRTLNKDGVIKFREWIESLSVDNTTEKPDYLITDPNYSNEITDSQTLPVKIFSTKYELAETLCPIVNDINDRNLVHFDSWEGIYTTLALFYFESICERDSSKWVPKALSRYIFGDNTNNKPKLYDHRIYGPITLYSTCSKSVRPFFEGKLGDPAVTGQYEMSIGSNNELAENPMVLETLKRLYVKKDGTIFVGFTGTKNYKVKRRTKTLDKPGGIRRIPKVCRQLRRTFDLSEISSDEFVKLLPKEFQSWLDA